MGYYRDQILPRLVDIGCRTESLGRWRERALEGISGVVVEPGFGAGSNVEYYPPEVTKVYAVDPATLGQKLSADRVAASHLEVEFVGLDGQDIPLGDGSCDAGVLTFSLCTIPDPMAALAEMRRVIKPGGRLHFAEHGLSDDPKVQKWQHRIDPFQAAAFDGCHVSRDHPALLRDAGFEIDWHKTAAGTRIKSWTFIHYGQAINPPSPPPRAG